MFLKVQDLRCFFRIFQGPFAKFAKVSEDLDLLLGDDDAWKK